MRARVHQPRLRPLLCVPGRDARAAAGVVPAHGAPLRRGASVRPRGLHVRGAGGAAAGGPGGGGAGAAPGAGLLGVGRAANGKRVSWNGMAVRFCGLKWRGGGGGG